MRVEDLKVGKLYRLQGYMKNVNDADPSGIAPVFMYLGWKWSDARPYYEFLERDRIMPFDTFFVIEHIEPAQQ